MYPNHNHMMYGSWDTEQDRIFCHFGPFFVLLPSPLMIPKIKILKKMKKMPRDIILLYIQVYHKWRSYDIWLLISQTEIFVILGHFLPFQSLDNLESQNFKIEENTWTYQFTCSHHKWQSYDVWFLRYVEQQTEFFVILEYFCPFTPLWTQKIKILKKWKTHLKILSFYKYVPYMKVIWYMVPEIWNATEKIFCHFVLFLYPPPNNPKNQNFEKLKKPLEILSFHTCVP